MGDDGSDRLMCPNAVEELMSVCRLDTVSAISKLVDDLGTLLHQNIPSRELSPKLQLLELLLNKLPNVHTHVDEPGDKFPLQCTEADCNNIYTRIFDGICLKLFKYIPEGGPASIKVQKHLYSLLSRSFPKAERKDQSTLVALCLEAIKEYTQEKKVSYGDGAHTPSNVLHVMNTLNSILETNSLQTSKENGQHSLLEEIFAESLQLISVADDNIAGKVIGLILPKLLQGDATQLQHKLQQLWGVTVAIFDQYGQKTFEFKTITEQSERPNLLLCGLADFLFPVSGFGEFTTDLFNGTRFWTLLQSGLFHGGLLTRKRSMYMLKRILDIAESQSQRINVHGEHGERTPLFWWLPGDQTALAKVWQDLILLLETMEERQIHVIKPVLQRLDNIIEATANRPDGLPYLHSSWLTTILQRCAVHESGHIKRWGVTQLLNIDLTRCPLIMQQQEFLCSTFISILTESTVYYKPAEMPLGECPPVGTAMQKFFQSVLTTLQPELRCQFFNHLLSGICLEYWSGAALVYVVQGMAEVTPTPVWDSTSLASIRELFGACSTAMNIHFRGAIQCLLLQAVMKLADGSKVSPADFAALLGSLKYGETIRRGTTQWLELVRWVRDMVNNDWQSLWTEDSIIGYLVGFVSDWMRVMPAAGGGDGGDDRSAVDTQQCLPAVRLLLLTIDTKMLLGKSDHPEGDSIDSVLAPVTATLGSMGSHAYMATAKADRALTFWYALMVECDKADADSIKCQGKEVIEEVLGSELPDDGGAFIHRTCYNTMKEVLMYIERRTTEVSQMKEFSSVQLHMDFLCQLAQMGGASNEPPLLLLDSLQPLVISCKALAEKQYQSVTLEGQLRKLSSVLLLATVCDLLSHHRDLKPSFCGKLHDFLQTWTVQTHLNKPLDLRTDNGSDRDEQTSTTWGRLSSEYIAAQWRSVHYHLQSRSPASVHAGYLDHCLESLDVISGQAVIPVIKCLLPIVPYVPEERLPELLKVVWGKVKEEATNALYWTVYELFVQLAFHHWILTNVPDMHPVLMEYAVMIFKIGEEKGGLISLMVKQLVNWWSTNNVQSAANMMDIVTKALMFGPLHSRGRRFMREVHCFLDSLGDQLPVNELSTVRSKDDSLVRVHVLNWLAKLSPSNPDHVTFVRHLVRELMVMQRELMRVASHRNFPNCLAHRQRHRLFCALLVLDQFYAEDCSEVFDFLMEMLVLETQVSVRCQIEWLIIRLVYRLPSRLETVWHWLMNHPETKTATLCSLLSIIAHVSKLPMMASQQEEFFMSGIPRVLPWCMDHHFNKRVFAQATLLTMWDMCKSRKLTRVLTTHALVEGFVSFTQENKAAIKKTKQLMQTFFFQFDPLQDYSIETIFHTLPYLTVLSDHEWVGPERFLEVDPTWREQGSHAVPLYNPGRQLKQCPPGMWKTKSPDQEGADDVAEGDVQKKLVPWRSMLPEEELGLDLQEEYSRKRQRAGSMVLVTSLISKIPNLGGLCRTCEIFGVSEYIVSNLRYIHDKAFQLLSVTAEKWIPIREVMPHHLKKYLLEMKQEGYTLVGAEQTANSQCLTDYKFPRQTLLLLGNEKEGIPVELIQLLDVCVEIPQQGVVRSLNVHVSGALLIWEYARQQLQGQAL